MLFQAGVDVGMRQEAVREGTADVTGGSQVAQRVQAGVFRRGRIVAQTVRQRVHQQRRAARQLQHYQHQGVRRHWQR